MRSNGRRSVKNRLDRFVSALLLLLLAVNLTACGQDGPSLQALPADAVVLAFGDSLTFGKGAKPGEAYPEILAANISRRVINAGLSGELSADGLQRLPALLEQHRPALVVLCHGGNDILRKKPFSEPAANLREMIRLSRESGAQVVMLGVPRFGLFLSAAPFYQQIADEAEVPIDVEVLSDILADNELKSDTVHPNAAGYARLAQVIETLLRERGAL